MRTLRMASVAILFTTLLAGTSFAQGRGQDRDYDRGRSSHNRGGIWSGPQSGIFYPQTGPRGWYQGQKNGWGNCNLPPGLARKQGCVPSYGYGYGNSRYPQSYYNQNWQNNDQGWRNQRDRDNDDGWRNNRNSRRDNNAWRNEHEGSRYNRNHRDRDHDREDRGR